MAKQAVAHTIDLEPIDRLEEKIKRLVDMVSQLRAEQAQAVDAQARLTAELETLRAGLAAAEGSNAELTAMREERDVIRERVADMLAQLDTI
jgi:regulator of replication initiation timing